MRPLLTNQRIMTWLCACASIKTASKWTKVSYASLTLALSVISVMALSGTIAFLWTSLNLEDFLYVLFQLAASVTMISSILTVYLSGPKITAIFKRLHSIYDAEKCKDDTSFNLLLRANDQSEWIWHIYLKFVIGGYILNFITVFLVSVLLSWLSYGAFDTKNLYHPYKLTLPWNQTTGIGYMGELCLDICIGETYLFSNGSLLLMFVSFCLQHQAFHNIFQYSLNQLNERDRKCDDFLLIRDLIQFQIDVKAWFLQTSNLYSPYILVQLMCSMFFLTSSVFEMDLQIHNIDFNVCMMLIGVLVGVGNLFGYCFYGRIATECYLAMADCLFESNWQRLSIGQQKYIVVMIANAQTPLYYHGSGIAILSLETFNKLIRSVCTYYMSFKTLAST